MNVKTSFFYKPPFCDRAWAILCALVVFSFGVLPGAVLAQNAKRQFSLPADIATRTLKLFSEQSGRPLLADAHLVRAVKTNAVQGEFTVDEAMDRMLAGTGLVAAKDEKSGAFTVTRARDAGSERRDPGTGRETQPAPREQSREPVKKNEIHTVPTMKPTRINRLLATLAAPLTVLIAQVDAQVAPAENAAAEPAIELSPFVVSSDRDTGYQATNTLAGTRLNTPLEDVGAAISIYNKDFLSDISATDHSELLIYATGMEAAGGQGNISGTFAQVGGVGTGTTREDPEGGSGFSVPIRTRGLSVPTRTRGFFATDIPSDSYNYDRVTVNRGPNAILFGVGNPGGIIDSTLLSANPSRNMNKVELRYGDNDSVRSVLDINRVLIRNKLAARIAGLYSREEYDQRPAYEEKKRLYGTVTYEPFRTTTIRTNFEVGRGNANRVSTIPARNSFAAWEGAGRRPFDWTFYDDPARNPAAASQNAQNFVPLDSNPTQFGDRVFIFFPDPAGSVPAGSFSNRIRLHVPNAAVVHPVFNRDGAADNFQFVGTRNISAIPAAWWPDSQPPAGLRIQTFTTYDVFDWRKRQLYESERQVNSFNTFNVSIEQRAWQNRIGVELAYDRQRYKADQKMGGEPGAEVSIDTNVTLPTGQPNPNLGRPYTVANTVIRRPAAFAREGMRATAYLKYDFRDLGPSWAGRLGRHVVSGIIEQNALEKLRGATRFQIDGPAALQASTDVLNGNRSYQAIYYLGPSIINNNNQVRLDPIRIPLPQPGDTFTTTYYNPATASLVSAPVTLVEFMQNSSPGAIRDVVKSAGVALQSYWLHEHLVTLVGWRRERDYFEQFSLITARNESRTGSNDPGQVNFGLGDFDFADTPPFLDGDEIISYSVVLKWPKKLVQLPRGTDLSAFYNTSDNFTPTGGRTDTFGDPLPPPIGKTREVGLNLSFFDGTLSIRANRFETSIVNQTIISGGLPTQIAETAITDTVAAWAREGNRNPGNVAFMNAAIAQLLGPLPSNYMDRRSFRVSGAAPDITTTYDRPQSSDTTDFTARGTEIGITYNPTRNWRIMANVAKTESVQANLYPVTKAMLALMEPAFNSTVTDPVSRVSVRFSDIPKGGYPQGFGPTNAPAANIERFGDYLNRAVVFPLANERAAEGQASPEQRRYRFNFVANYTFGRETFGGKLNGWGIGGGYRWQGRIALGYPSSIDANGVAHFDIANPYWGPAETNVDAWLSYKRKIWSDRINWKAQLNVKNLIGGSGLIPIRTQPWGEHAQVRIPPEKRWYITNSFEF
jgi:catecholate siderophore receptor